jgi:hypothetical protein
LVVVLAAAASIWFGPTALMLDADTAGFLATTLILLRISFDICVVKSDC